MSKINTLCFEGSISSMTADQLQAHREAGTVLHCQTMRRLPRDTSSRRLIYTDVEEVTRDQLNMTVLKLEKEGWQCSGAHFTRKRAMKA